MEQNITVIATTMNCPVRLSRDQAAATRPARASQAGGTSWTINRGTCKEFV